MTTNMVKTAKYNVPGFSKGIKLIELLSETNRPLGLTEASNLLGLNQHMTLRLLQTLVQEGWVIEEEIGPKYRLSLKPFCITSKPLIRNDLLQVAAEPIRQMHNEIGESTSLGILNDNRVLYVLHFNGTRAITVIGHVGNRYLLQCAAAGKVLLAHADESLVDRLVAEGLEALTPNSKTTKEAIMEDRAKTLKQGYALDNEEYAKGLICFAAPIYDYTGHIVAALNTSVLLLHYSMEEFIEKIGSKVLETSQTISIALGHIPSGNQSQTVLQ
ncbi:MAG: IclR family transcriptional regulator [Planctomycetaceae bacterium]|jgi:DNA-binding IclR family transcriptional regulator|nr:IclR family transcriptional regulator [Planctomycetaceae bacterium]